MPNQTHRGLLTSTQVAEIVGVPIATVEAWRRLRIGPPAVKIGTATMWRLPAVTAWLADGGALDFGIALNPVHARDGMRHGDGVTVRIDRPGQGASA